MKHKTLFRLAVKLLGLYFLVSGLAQLAYHVVFMVCFFHDRGFGALPPNESMMLASVIPSLVMVAFGAYLFFGGGWIVERVIPGNHPFCPQCGYDLTGAAQNRCPECGTPFAPQEVKPGQPPEPRGADEAEGASGTHPTCSQGTIDNPHTGS